MDFLLNFFKGFIGTLNSHLLTKAEPFLLDEAKALARTGERAIEILFNFELTAEEKKDAFEGWRNSFELFSEACKREGSVIASDISGILLSSMADNFISLFTTKK